MQTIAEAIASVTSGTPARHHQLTVTPLMAPEELAPGYVLLDDALAREVARVTEVSESGSVPELLFVNDGDERVLLIDGEELVGARQNRILNVSILAGAKRTLTIPVSCVEHGRWSYRRRDFTASAQALFARARAKKAAEVTASLRRTGTYDGNQGEIWSDIDAKAAYFRVESSTDSMADLFAEQRALIDQYVAAFEPLPRQTGALFAIGGRIAGMELFDAAATWRALMPKILRSYALDAIEDAHPDARAPAEAAVRSFLEDVQAAVPERFPAVGEGEDLRLESATLAGGALAADGRIVHLCAFRVAPPAPRPIGRGGRVDFEIPAFLRRPARTR